MEPNPDSIQSQGGKARAEKLSANQIKAISSKGNLLRWGAKATHRGNFKAEFGTDVECYVLDDAMKTPVISQSGMAEAIGLSVRGNAFPRFLESKAMADSVSADLRKKLTQTIKFQWSPVGAMTPNGSRLRRHASNRCLPRHNFRRAKPHSYSEARRKTGAHNPRCFR
jgi:hypothetical protein